MNEEAVPDLRSTRRYGRIAAGTVLVVAAAIAWYVVRGTRDHEVSFRVSAAPCTANVLVTVGRGRDLIVFENEIDVRLPFERPFTQRHGDHLSINVTSRRCQGPLQCQILIDGVERAVATEAGQVTCKATVGR